jgi:hypothetical protein
MGNNNQIKKIELFEKVSNLFIDSYLSLDSVTEYTHLNNNFNELVLYFVKNTNFYRELNLKIIDYDYKRRERKTDFDHSNIKFYFSENIICTDKIYASFDKTFTKYFKYIIYNYVLLKKKTYEHDKLLNVYVYHYFFDVEYDLNFNDFKLFKNIEKKLLEKKILYEKSEKDILRKINNNSLNLSILDYNQELILKTQKIKDLEKNIHINNEEYKEKILELEIFKENNLKLSSLQNKLKKNSIVLTNINKFLNACIHT